MPSNLNKKKIFTGRIALISAPWPLFERPSIQLGALKGYLQTAEPEVKVSCSHFFLQMAEALGYPSYRMISQRTWLAESVYAALLYPEHYDRIEKFFNQQAPKNKDGVELDFLSLTKQVKAVSDDFITQTDWNSLDLAGFSVCLCQLTASLYFIRQIRRRCFDLPLIAGGSIIAGHTAGDLLAAFPEIDLIISGEGELPLTKIIRHLKKGGLCNDLFPSAGIISRKHEQKNCQAPFSQLADLKSLPLPDFSEYFELLSNFSTEKKFFPILPVEMSRGCWWKSKGESDSDIPGSNRSKGCAFCNLNLQWEGYRRKSAGQAINEIDTLTDKHRLLSAAFMDNSLPGATGRKVFDKLTNLGKDLYCFAELRASEDYETLRKLSAGGVKEVQVGIEALSSRLLKKINKGTTATDNLEMMKNCEALGIKNTANIILHFPGSDEEDVAETLRVLRFARFFRPLHIVHFWLGIQSPVWTNPRKYGLLGVYNHPYYRHLFPDEILRQVRFMIQDYRGNKMFQKKLWRPVDQAVRQWQKDYNQIHSKPYSSPALTFHDGGKFLILRERRAGLETINHRLEGSSRQIYMFCSQSRPFNEIRDQFPSFSADNLKSFLAMMTRKELMFEEDERYLSLAVPATGRDFRPAAQKGGPAHCLHIHT